METSSIILLIVGAMLLVAVTLFVARMAREAIGAPSAALPVAEDGTGLDRLVAPLIRANPGRTGLTLLVGNVDAYAKRALAARSAERSLDLQYYYWQDDLSGGLLAREVLLAADRGVRVRFMIDDINTSGRDKLYRAFGHHPNIEVRLFNPSRNRANALVRSIELVLRAFKATRRMHNKAWIADGRVAIIGGRNVGDAYFDAGRASNFHDMDLILAGAAVAEAERVFDTFWNSAEVVPIDSLVRRNLMTLPRLRRRLERLAASRPAATFRQGLAEKSGIASLLEAERPMRWIEGVRVVSDPPQKAASKDQDGWIGRIVLETVSSARTRLNVISPYFIPQDNGVAVFGNLVDEGADVAILTNSLAATDVVATYGAYATYRKGLLRRGVKLYELRPDGERRGTSLFGSKGASLHTKAFTIDGALGFVGSFNFDPRSVALNTEMGVLFKDETLVADVDRVFELQIAAQSSYMLALERGRVVWKVKSAAGTTSRDYEPRAGFWRRLFARFVRWLPIESQL